MKKTNLVTNSPPTLFFRQQQRQFVFLANVHATNVEFYKQRLPRAFEKEKISHVAG